MSIFGAGRLVRENAVVTIQSASTITQVEGGTSETFTTLLVGVPVLITGQKGDRIKNFGTEAERTDVTVTGVENKLGRPDVRFLITAYPDRADFVGMTLRINSSNEHPAGLGGLQCARVECKCSILELPPVLA